MWTTRIDWRDSQNWVVLMRDGIVIAEISLNDWAELGATTLLVTDAADQVREARQQEALGSPGAGRRGYRL